MPPGRSLGGHPSGATPAHLAGLDADPDAPNTHLSSGQVQAGGADYEGEETIPDGLDATPVRRGGRPKVKHEHVPTHFMT